MSSKTTKTTLPIHNEPEGGPLHTMNRGRLWTWVGPAPEATGGPRGGAPEARDPGSPSGAGPPDSGSSTATRTGERRDCRGTRSRSNDAATAGHGPP